jgi:nitrous oxide reductase accessory protein NosL
MFFFFLTVNAAMSQEDVTKFPSCPLCGMDRAKFAHSRVFIEYGHGQSAGFCSLHCAAIDLALKIDQSPAAIMVGDYKSKKLIEAEKAYWVIGGEKMGVMTRRAKWAFENKHEAEAFIKESGGNLATFETAIKATFEDMYEDVMMIRKKRQMMRKKKQGH